MREAIDDHDRFLTADLDFHMAVANSAHNSILMNALEMIANLMQQWIRQALLVPSVSEEALVQHKAIFMGIAKRNSDEARRAMQAHLDAMSQRLGQARGLSLGSTGPADEVSDALGLTSPASRYALQDHGSRIR